MQQLEWNALYAARFSADKKFVRGRLLGLYFDASDSKVEIGTDVQFRDYCQVRTGMNGKLTIITGFSLTNIATLPVLILLQSAMISSFARV